MISVRVSAWIWRLERLRLIRRIARPISCWVTGLRAMIFTLCLRTIQQPLRIIRTIYPLEPDDVDAVTKLGAVLLRMQDQQAIARQILPFMKRHPEALDLLPVAAQWAYRAGDYERASVYWDRFLEQIDAQTLALYVDPTPILSDAQRADLQCAFR